MASCSVKWCGKNSRTSNFMKDGITFHRFPKCPEKKSEWIKATFRDDGWLPRHTSVICSRHFTDDSFFYMKDRRRIMESAVPTLYLPALNPSPSANMPQEELRTSPVRITSIVKRKIIPFPDTLTKYYSPTEKHLCRRIQELRNIVQRKNRALKTMRSSNRRLRKQVSSLQSLLADTVKNTGQVRVELEHEGFHTEHEEKFTFVACGTP